jgi:hypothetical protein
LEKATIAAHFFLHALKCASSLQFSRLANRQTSRMGVFSDFFARRNNGK